MFINRIPERYAPGKFDIVGASHQWWHLAVWAAGSVWMEASIRYFEWRIEHVDCKAPPPLPA
jgi:adiponectin receptor